MEDDNNISTITFTGDYSDTYTIDISSMTDYTTISSNSGIYLNTDGITLSNDIFKDYMPGVYEVESMCTEYPALEKAYENFKTIYKMVHQDWVGKQKEDGDLLL